MSSVKLGLFVSLAVVTALFLGYWILAVRRSRNTAGGPAATAGWPTPVEWAIGFVTNFFDTLGIGSFAPTTVAFRARKVVPDRVIPGTLNVGHGLPVIVQAFIYMAIVEIDAVTLALLIGASVAGAWLGAGVVASWPKRKIQIGMGLALLAAAGLMLMTQFDLFPAGGEAVSLGGPLLGVAIVGNLMLGALMTLGIGMYAPSLIMISLLGMNPRAAFPIMMGSCAFLMPVGSIRFIARDAYALRPALGLTLGGIPAVLIAAYIVGSLPLTAIRWLVVAVVVYTGVSMLRSARRETSLPTGPDTVT